MALVRPFTVFLRAMKKVLLFLFIIYSIPLVGQHTFFANYHGLHRVVEVSILEASYLVINGKTNVNKFHCYYHQLSTKPLPVVLNQLENSITVKNAALILQTHQFDCNNQMMNKDFQQLLQSEAYPQIEIEILRLHQSPHSDRKLSSHLNEVSFTIWVQALFRIVGNEHQYSFPVKVIDNSDDALNLQGSVDLNLLDFDITPPKKLLGLVEVQELITIDFFAKLRVAQP